MSGVERTKMILS